MAVRLQIRNDTSTNWTLADPILLRGEIGYDTTARQFKIGDGNTRWLDLDYTLTGPPAEPPSDVRTDYVYPHSYCGSAPQGALENSAVWTIKRIQINVDGSATITTATNVEWVDRLTVAYS